MLENVLNRRVFWLGAAIVPFSLGCGDDSGVGRDAQADAPADRPQDTVCMAPEAGDAGPFNCMLTDPTCTAPGMCCAPSDLSAVQDTYGDLDDQCYGHIVRDAATTCVLGGDQTQACIITEIDAALPAMPVGATCKGCFAASALCGARNCVVPCLGTDTGACNRCLCGENAAGADCLGDWETCSGLTTTLCDSCN